MAKEVFDQQFKIHNCYLYLNVQFLKFSRLFKIRPGLLWVCCHHCVFIPKKFVPLVVSIGLFLSLYSFLYNGVCQDVLKLSANDIILSQKGSNGEGKNISLGWAIILLTLFVKRYIFGQRYGPLCVTTMYYFYCMKTVTFLNGKQKRKTLFIKYVCQIHRSKVLE